MSDLEILKKEAFKLAKQPLETHKTHYFEYDGIYIAPTSNTKQMMKLYKDCKKVLTVGSTGAIGYEALLNGATEVDLFDINNLQRLYFMYQKTAITILKYEEFIKHFTLTNQTFPLYKSMTKNLLSNELFDKLYPYLDKEVKEVFGALYDFYYSQDLILSALFRFEHTLATDYLKRTISYYNKEQYYQLQKILREEKAKITYQPCSLIDVPKIFQEKYDLIALDNILQYYETIPELNTISKINMFIKEQLANVLNENGLIHVMYGFEVETDALKEVLNFRSRKTDSQDNLEELLKKFILKNYMNKSVCAGLIKGETLYSYTIIEGVEEEHGQISDNVVLTYQKK